LNTQFLEIYRVGESIYGTPIRGATTYQLRLEYDNCFNFPGKSACFFLVSRDDSIRREDALKFATDIAQGKMVCHHIDLSQWDTVGTIYPIKPTEVKL
jgi:hypothetical protein